MTHTNPASSTENTIVTTHLYRERAQRDPLRTLRGDRPGRPYRPSQRRAAQRSSLHVRAVVAMLEGHAGHEDVAVQPALEVQSSLALAARISADHELIAVREIGLVELADGLVEAPKGLCAQGVHQLYLELAHFTGVYLAHQDVEERHVLPALESAIGPEAVEDIHRAIVSSIPPDEMAKALAVMLPAMNIDNRVDMLGGMKAGAPPRDL